MLTNLSEIIDLIKFNSQSDPTRHNAHAIFVASSEDKIFLAKAGALSLRILGWNSYYIGTVEQHIDPFFDIDFQRYIMKSLGCKKRVNDSVYLFFSGEFTTLYFPCRQHIENKT